MVISPASLVTLSTDRWQELGELLARRAEPSSDPATDETSSDQQTDPDEEEDPDGQH